MMNRAIAKILVLAIRTLIFLVFSQTVSLSQQPTTNNRQIPDVSGIAWVNKDCFLAVHDAKDTGSEPSPRVSILQLPSETEKFTWQPLAIDWPKSLGISRDLESITAIPETNLFLMAESGDRKPYQRIFLAAYEEQDKGQCLRGTQLPQIKIIADTVWPVPVKNIEAMTVTKINDQYIFIYAERADGEGNTQIHWTTLTLNPLQFGEFRSVTFESPFGSGINTRQISDLTIDRQQNLYIASTVDPGVTGVFRSAIYLIGKISTNNNIVLDPEPLTVGEIDGLKVEGITLRSLPNEEQIYYGSDDENYGGVFRRVL